VIIPHEGLRLYAIVFGVGGYAYEFLEGNPSQLLNLVKWERDEHGLYCEKIDLMPCLKSNGLKHWVEELENSVGDRVYLHGA
jgi:hypothetical protein